MAWDDSDEARRVVKLLKNGLLAPEDLRPNEFRLLKQHHSWLSEQIRVYLETRSEMIENGNWSEELEPDQDGRRIERYEDGRGLVDHWNDRN